MKPTLHPTMVAVSYVGQDPTSSIVCFFPPISLFKITNMAQLSPSVLQIATQAVNPTLHASNKA